MQTEMRIQVRFQIPSPSTNRLAQLKNARISNRLTKRHLWKYSNAQKINCTTLKTLTWRQSTLTQQLKRALKLLKCGANLTRGSQWLSGSKNLLNSLHFSTKTQTCKPVINQRTT